MLNNFKSLPIEAAISEYASAAFLGTEAHPNLKTNPLFYPSILESYAALAGDLSANRLLNVASQNLAKNGASPTDSLSASLLPGIQKPQTTSASKPSTVQQGSIESKPKEEDKESDDSGSDSDEDSSKRRGKYKTYTEPEKAHIITFMAKHGIQKTLELFSGGEHKITKRKLKSWLDSQNKVKGVKGRKSNDPARDQYLYEWCIAFQTEHGRPPSRKETTQQALKLSEDPNFQASKGWLDKFSRKFGVEFTPLKIVPPRNRKKLKTDSESNSGAKTPNEEEVPAEPISSINPGRTELDTQKSDSVTTNEESNQDGENNSKPVLTTGQGFRQIKRPTQTQTQPQSQPQKQIQPQSKSQIAGTAPHVSKTNNEQALTSKDSNIYQALAAQNFSNPLGFPLNYNMPSFPLDFAKMNPLNSQNNASMNFPMNFPTNLQLSFIENLLLLQQMMDKDNELPSQNS